MATGNNIKTYFNNQWHDCDLAVIKAADHGAWLGSGVFDGARYFNGGAPDLEAHCTRLNASAKALMLTPTHSVSEMKALIWEGLARYSTSAAVYIRPMYWGIDGDLTAIVPSAEATGFAVSLEEIPFAAPETSATLGRTQFRRPILESAVVNAKAGCLYPNNARMLVEARRKGFNNALVTDAMGNVAETATANIFMVRDGEVFTPAPNGTFLAGITRSRHIKHLKEMGIPVHETVLNFGDFYAAEEVFMTGNMQKITPVTAIEETHFQIGPIAERLREAYWDWAASTAA